MGRVLAHFSECERQLAAIAQQSVGLSDPTIKILLREIRGVDRVLSFIRDCLSESNRIEDARTFSTIVSAFIDFGKIRNRLAHGILASLVKEGRHVLVWSQKGISSFESDTLIRFLDPSSVTSNFIHYSCEVWTPEDFEAAANASRGMVNTLSAFSVCLARGYCESTSLHEKIRTEVLLASPPWGHLPPQQLDGV
jgi:hypothetical protein